MDLVGKKLKHYAIKTSSGELEYENPMLYSEHLRSLPFGKRLEITLGEYKSLLSDRQKAYYFAVVVKMFCEEIGELPDDMHYILKDHFLREEIDGHPGLYRVGSITGLTTQTFWDYIEQCRLLYFNMFNGVIPDPYITGYRER